MFFKTIIDDLMLPTKITQTREYLMKIGFRNHIKISKSQLSPDHINNRIAFSNFHQNENFRLWAFSDEKSFYTKTKGHRSIKCKRGERTKVDNFQLVNRVKKRVNFWGVIGYNFVFIKRIENRFNADTYLNLLTRERIPEMVRNSVLGPCKFIQDGARFHWTAPVTNYLDSFDNFELVRNFPAFSPDLTVIENFWGILEKKVDQVLFENPNIDDENRLEAIVHQQAALISQQTVRKLIDSMPRRINYVIKNAGRPIPY